MSSADTAKVAALARKAAGADATASRTAPIAGPIDDAQVLDGMQQRVGGADPRFAHQSREQG